MYRGLPVSPGVAVGTAYCLAEILLRPGTPSIKDQEVAAELGKYEAALEKSNHELHAIEARIDSHVGGKAAAIFQTHRSILRDTAFTVVVPRAIVEERLSAGAALHRLLEQYTTVFSKLEDDYLRERLADIQDVILRVNSHLSDPVASPLASHAGPLIVVADELLPSQVVMLGHLEVNGIVTQGGSQTSHAALVARSRGIPAVSGVDGILREIKTGETVIVDGRRGHVIVNPDAETRAAYRKLEREFFHFRDQLAENRDHPAVTADGMALELLANINSVADAKAAAAMGASGVGLFRTEYLYLTHPVVPGEEEQLEEYQGVIEASPRRRVTIRTLDLGGDKTLPFLGHVHREANPFMGWRSIRLCFEYPEFLLTQLRAVMRSAAVARRLGGEVRLLFPMITTVEEMQRVRGLVEQAQQQLAREGKAFANVALGMMLEVPAAAVSLDTMLDEVDFVSIGSNDLIQYLMAADRDNPKVSHLCQPLAPPVLRVLAEAIRCCNAAGKPLTVCGEMAGQPLAFALLVGMGLRSFSMSPAFVPYIKELASQLTATVAQEVLRQALRLRTTAEVTGYLASRLGAISPLFNQFGGR